MAKAAALPVFLKSITIQGFKSFADRVKLELGHGLSVVVGPNGSGKSNVADAIRWVLGEQSAKNLRGSKMEDVIFAGSSARRPVGMAEVSLVFDNTTGIFPLDYQEVVITRRVYRDGEGQYFINRSSCRLKDIHELFMDTGAGKEGFSIIGQGRVEELLNQKSEDRRTMLEEASGITKYRMRKREALKRLDETERNLERIRDILVEIEGQLGPLEEQAAIAKEAVELTTEQKALEIEIVAHDLKEVRTKLNSSAQETEELQAAIAETVAALGQKESEILYSKVNLNQADEKIQKQQETTYAIDQSLNEIIQEIRLRKEREGYLNEQISRVTTEVKDNEEKVRGSAEQLRSVESRKSLLLKTIQESNQTLQEDEQRFAEAKAKNGLEELEALRGNLALVQKELTESAAEISRVTHQIDALSASQNQWVREKRDKEASLATYEQEEEAILDQIKVQEDRHRESRQELEEIQQDLMQLREQNKVKQSELRQMSGELEKKSARYHALKNLEDSLEGYQRGVRELMQAKKKGVATCQQLCGTLADLLQVEERHEVAIEVALGGGIQNIVAETEKGAKEAVHFLKTHNLGRATFLPLDVIQGGQTNVAKEVANDPGFIGLAVDLITFQEKYRKAFESQLGRIVVVTDMEAATRVARASGYRARIVTLEGDQVHPGGSLTGGSYQRKGSNILGRSRELQELQQECEARRRQLRELEEEINLLNTRMQGQEEGLKALAGEEQELKSALAVLRTHQLNLHEQIQRLKAEITDLNLRLEGMNQEVEELLRQKTRREEEQLQHKARLHEAEGALSLQEEQNQKASLELEVLQESLTQAKIQAAKWEQELKQATERIEEGQAILLESNQLLEQKRQDLVELEEGKARIVQEQRDWDTQRQETAELQQQAQEKLVALRQEREVLSKELIEQERLAQSQRQEQQGLEQKLHNLEVRLARWDAEWETGYKRLQEEFALTWEEAQAYQTERSQGGLTARVQEIKQRLESLGPVNQAAIEEFPKHKERFEFLSVQKQDLEEANDSLHDLIGELDVTMAERFQEGFTAVNEAFQVVFKELFNGGFAELRLVDPDNLLETGVEIIAQPPGKKAQLLSLLSGGERALTAIGLLFALLKVKPSPFCILDEIEASLDDANVSRFAQYVHRLANSTQFLVISHRKGTMEAADVLYGISMEESGVSKLLSVKLAEQDKDTQTA
ncbi:chromosome segregation protein SMC [Desulfitobacterium sp. THU1]|uniref:chromosome segregation protein SMC n=1 Tax=Desulfitobacterium sp. THU1 TaxID=3138072 RepID=UPI00311D7A80